MPMSGTCPRRADRRMLRGSKGAVEDLDSMTAIAGQVHVSTRATSWWTSPRNIIDPVEKVAPGWLVSGRGSRRRSMAPRFAGESFVGFGEDARKKRRAAKATRLGLLFNSYLLTSCNRNDSFGYLDGIR